MITWTIYITFAGAVLLLLLPRPFARWLALLRQPGTTASIMVSAPGTVGIDVGAGWAIVVTGP